MHFQLSMTISNYPLFLRLAAARYFHRAPGQGTTANSFEWPSDSTTERTFSLDLSHYAFVTALEMRFPVGDTYKFDIWLRDEDGKRLQAFSVRSTRLPSSAYGTVCSRWFCRFT